MIIMSQLILKGVIISFNYESGMMAKNYPLFPRRYARNTTVINNDSRRKYAKKKMFLVGSLLFSHASELLHIQNHGAIFLSKLFGISRILQKPACVNDEDTRS